MPSRVFFAVLVLIVVWIVVTLWQGSLLAKGSEAPDWTLLSADGTGERISLKQYKGKVVVLDFFSTNCGPCIKAIPGLNSISEKMKEEDVVVIGIATPGESEAEIRMFARSYNTQYPLVIDKTGSVSSAYIVRALPTIYIVDRDGKVAEARGGFWQKTALEAAVSRVAE